ncbi:sensor histidine kinase [Cryptosporangium aurantiacum]|uniref:sensor histidine kinase n=1 Tax=Cryptosporangium aurantiacum TaxID=134849 RepID=UPI0011611286|nr:ATP-binding protein [Cryptosporangium aurantiacum]
MPDETVGAQPGGGGLPPLERGLPPLDAADAFTAITRILDDVAGGPVEVPALRRVMDALEQLVGGVGAAFLLAEPGAMRAVATSDSVSWLTGRRLPLSGSSFARLFGGPHRTIEFGWADATPVLREDLRERGCEWILMTRVVRRFGPLGALAVAIESPRDGQLRTERAVLECLAAGVGALAVIRPDRLPDPIGTVAAAVPEGVAVVDAGGLIQAWNPAAEEITEGATDKMLNQPLPFPVPVPGQVREHRLQNGRWIEARCAALDASRRVVTFYDVSESRREDEAQNLFLATASHELRTPLTIIRGYADTLVTRWDQLDDVGRRSAAEVIGTRTRQLAALVDRLLSGDRAGGTRPETQAFDVRTALASALASAPANEDGHRLRARIPATLPAAIGEPDTIPTIVTELLTNAYKYSPDGGDIEVSAGADVSAVWFRVADRGVGVPPDQAESVFARFWQVDRGDQRRFGGVGLGLYIIRQLLDRQGGWVSLRPRLGGGSVVEVRLRRADHPRPTAEGPAS